MRESLTPEKIKRDLSTGDINKETAAELLISLIECSEDSELRIESIKTLEKINFRNETLFKTLENHLISDENAIVRALVAKFIVNHFLFESLPALKWVIQHEKSPLVLKLIFELLTIYNTPQLMSVKSDLKNWQKDFANKIGVVPQESKFFLDLEALFAKGKRNYEINPISYHHFKTLSDIKNGEPWLVIHDKHVEVLNYNYFRWKFIKNHPDIIDSLSNLQDLDIYFCSIKRYSYNFSDIPIIPESIGSLTFLKKLILKRNGLKMIPSSIENLIMLKELDLSYNNFEEIPYIIPFLNKLEKFNIKHNKIHDIPRSFRKFAKTLEHFNF